MDLETHYSSKSWLFLSPDSEERKSPTNQSFAPDLALLQVHFTYE